MSSLSRLVNSGRTKEAFTVKHPWWQKEKTKQLTLVPHVPSQNPFSAISPAEPPMRQTLRGRGGCGLQVGSRGPALIVPGGSGTCLHLAPNPFSNMERGSLKDILGLIKRRIGAESECLLAVFSFFLGN